MIGSMMSTAAFVGLGTLALLYALYYWKFLASRRYCKSSASLAGKTVIVTGGNSGIGKATALDLARRGTRVILACRNLQKAEDAAKEIKARTGNSEVVVHRLDLASLKSVREFAERMLESESRLDILINNAGLGVVQDRTVTEDNFHMLYGTNYLGPFLLTNLLVGLLTKSAPSRVVTVSSNGHNYVWQQLNFTRHQDGVRGNGGVLYPHLNSHPHGSLANILFMRELARRLKSKGVTAVSLHPGLIYSPIWKTAAEKHWILTLLYHIFIPLIWLICIDEETGAQTTLHCALDESVPHLSGRYFANCAVAKESALARDDELARKLWEVSCQATGFKGN